MAEYFSFENAKFLYSFKNIYLNILNKKKFKIFLFVIYFSLILCFMKLKVKNGVIRYEFDFNIFFL
jgi:hypothetical protein